MIETDFRKFSPLDYLQEYYSEIGSENRFLLNFFHRAYSTGFADDARLLEIGGGPTIYQLISASTRVQEIIFSDYLEENLNQIRLWTTKSSDAYNWNEYFSYVATLEKGNARDLENQLREKIVSLQKCDIFSRPVVSDIEKIMALSVNFCPESVTDEEGPYKSALRNIVGMLSPGGFLVMTCLKNAKSYKVGNTNFPAFPIDEEYIRNVLYEFGFKNIFVDSVPAEGDHTYEGLIGVYGVNSSI